jgi:Uncharacterized protein conserved in bacteria (DUF2225)
VESSSSPRGLRLDLRQLGDVVDPPTLPQCPKCRFPLFSDQLSEPVIERLKPFVLGVDFQMLAGKNPSYFSLAQVQEFLRAPHRYIALSYLRASWQVEDRETVSRRLLEKAHSHFVSALAEMKAGDRQFADAALLCGEVERRLGKWEEAAKRFRELEAGPGLNDPKLKLVLALQFKLIEARDTAPHAMDGTAAAAGTVREKAPDAPSEPAVVPGANGPADANPAPNLSEPRN